jgi:acyl-CoA reductase-like NAD-dependent aldehyde dehydrogenase
LCVEAGKPIADSEGEVTRLIDTFRIAAEEATRNYGEVQPLDISARAKGYMGMWKRVPIGPCSFISPFNFPLNLAAHKIAPAIAIGCPFVMKPASLTPLGAIIMGEVLAECDILPEGAFSILPASRAGADLFTTDERLKLLSFTGSPGVGWDLKAKAGKKKVVLELGGNAAVIVDKDADLDHALARIVFGGYYQSGQSCIHVQRAIIHADIYDTFRDMLTAKVKTLKAGDPKLRDTFIGPMISVKEAQRLKGWIDDAVAAGATLLAGGGCEGNMLEAALPLAPSSSCRNSPTGKPRSPRSTTASSGFRRASSRATSTRCWRRGIISTSAASSSTTCRAIASTTCPMAGSRTAASAAKACGSPWKI